MSLYNNNNNENNEMIALISWNSTLNTSTYSPSELQALRRPSGNGTGYKYYNYHRDVYEFPRQISLISKKKLETLKTRSASIASGANKNENPTTYNNKLPAHLRLHQHFTGGPGFSITA
jgi:hypothetical protein